MCEEIYTCTSKNKHFFLQFNEIVSNVIFYVNSHLQANKNDLNGWRIILYITLSVKYSKKITRIKFLRWQFSFLLSTLHSGVELISFRKHFVHVHVHCTLDCQNIL